ncbi:MAG: hypothetical protein IKA30_02785 [Alphaproteobacteria bacterium]|nr:hypothetical protein [Alphaproteobacteria bacterium]
MKIFTLMLGVFLSLITNVQANIYHGIDIDKIYEISDWNSKDDIKKLIDDYTLLLQYQKELNNCPIELPDVLDCYDKTAEKIITTLFVQTEYNLEIYKNFKKALSEFYGLKNCRNKYAWPSGQMCNIDKMSDVSNMLKKHIQDLIDFSKEKMFEYSPILEDYK